MMNFWVMTSGKFIFGIGVGIQCPVICKYIEETVPAYMFASLVTLAPMSQTIGGNIAYGFGELLPPNKDRKALKDT